VTRFGEFSPIGRSFSLASFTKINKKLKFLANLFHGRSYALILTKGGLRHTLGDFFTNSSGHPVGNAAAFPDVCSCQSFDKTLLHNLHITYLCNIFGLATQQPECLFLPELR
jgi:hypothetical protein